MAGEGGREARFWSLSEAISFDLGALEAHKSGIPIRFARISPSRARRSDGSRRLTGVAVLAQVWSHVLNELSF